MFKLAQKAKILGAFVLASYSLPAFANSSYWEHNGSIMLLITDQDRGANWRDFYYIKPSPKMREAGITGNLEIDPKLFEGYRQGNKYYGTARVFSKYCDNPLEYDVSGNVSKDERQVILTGRREIYNKSCRPTGKYVTDKLIFNYLGQNIDL